jgi:signal transduction histidine kinase
MNPLTPLLNFAESVSKNFVQTIVAVALFGSIKNRTVSAKGQVLIAEEDEKRDQKFTALQRENALKDQLLSILSHDFRSPLYSLKSLLGLLATQKINQQEFQRVVGLLESQVEYLDQFTENILRWTRNNATEIKPKLEPLALHPLVRETVDLLSYMAERKGIRIYYDISENSMVFADGEMIKLVLRNLIMNAIKFCFPNDSVYIRANHQDEMISISVCDTGQGIGLEKISGLFDASHDTTKGTRNEIGVGLGLTLCKEFVEKMGGTIRVTRPAEKGSCFEFTVHSPTTPSSDFQMFIEAHEKVRREPS